MTETTAEETGGDLTVSVVLYPSGGDSIALRQIGYGVQPFILIEPSIKEGTDDVTINVVGSHVDSLEELVESLEAFTQAVRDAVEQQEAS